ncbi:hypothetical protein ZHAS_00016067 [Anopheles sinensis]|uniref:Uncharacterized protein n=1 Tax=Anopheles sinensis TaxID=74873 RepID=A0A084WD00_ANOSI|nr:hypothetical protein ZHAS_00016067 [Anopheles sinensis]
MKSVARSLDWSSRFGHRLVVHGGSFSIDVRPSPDKAGYWASRTNRPGAVGVSLAWWHLAPYVRCALMALWAGYGADRENWQPKPSPLGIQQGSHREEYQSSAYVYGR